MDKGVLLLFGIRFMEIDMKGPFDNVLVIV